MGTSGLGTAHVNATSEQMALPYLPAQGRGSTARRISHGICVKKAHTRLCLTTIQPCKVPLVPKQETIFSCSFLSLKTSSFITRQLPFFSSPFKILHGLPAFLLSPTHYCSKLACDYFNHQSSLPLCCSPLLIKMTLLCSFSITVIKAC